VTLTSERAVRRDVVVRDPSRFNASMATGSASAQYLLFRVAHECSLHFNFKEATADSTGIKCPQSFLIKPPLPPLLPPPFPAKPHQANRRVALVTWLPHRFDAASIGKVLAGLAGAHRGRAS